MEAERDFCPSCERETKTVLGRCPQCGYPKSSLAVPQPPVIRGHFWEELEDASWWLWVLPGCLGLIVLAVVLFGAGALLAVAVLVVLVAAVAGLVGVW